ALAACGGHEAPPAPPPPAAATSEDLDRPLPDPLPKIAARVNDEAIYTRRIQAISEPALVQGKEPAEKARPAAYRNALSQLVVRELLFQEALRRGLAADTKKV